MELLKDDQNVKQFILFNDGITELPKSKNLEFSGLKSKNGVIELKHYVEILSFVYLSNRQ